MISLAFILSSFVLLYALWLIIIIAYWRKPESKNKAVINIGVSIIIPFRNEENNLHACIKSILNQTYDLSLVEIILIDDHSTDSSCSIASEYKNCKCVSLPTNVIGKKQAISKGVELASNELIVIRDADTISETHWLKTLIEFQQTTNAAMVIAQVKLAGSLSFFSSIQQLEHFALTIITGGTANMNSPILCNGANLLFKKSEFIKVKGYEGNEKIASGDDVFLMNKFKTLSDEKIIYLKNIESFVTCKTETNFSKFINQRVRWASKNKHIKSLVNTFTGLIILLANFSWPILGVLSIFYPQLAQYFLITTLLKCIIDFLLLFLASSFYKQEKYLIWFPLFFCVYPIQLIAILLLSLL